MRLFLKYKILILIALTMQFSFSIYAQVDMSIVVTFEQAPSSATAIKAPLKYNKDFALSMQIDDGHESIYTDAFPVFMGGEYGSQTLPGLTYTDGCGNEINFKMSTAQFSFNGDSENGPDTHVPGSGYSMVTWPQMDILYKNGWGIINHGVNGNASSAPNFMEYSLNRNKSYTRRKLINTTEGGVLTNVHVNPNGQTPWSQAAFDLGYLAALNQDSQSSFMGDHGGDVNSSEVNWLNPQVLFRLHNNNVNVTSYVGDLADSSANGANYWGSIFTHSIGGEYPFNSFYSDFSIIESNFGTPGADNIFMATDEEIISYLLTRESLNISTTLAGSSLFISLSGDLPNDMHYYALSLIINADENISNILVIGADSINHSGYGNHDGLINLYWDGEYIIPSEVLADSMTTIAANTQQQRDGWVAMDYVITMENGAHKDSLRNVLCNLPTTVYDDGFCDCNLDLGFDSTFCIGNCATIYGPDGFNTYEWIVADTIYSTTQNIFVCPTDTTQYILNAENEFCLASDTIVFNVNPLPIFELGNDTTICLQDSLTIYGPDTTGLDYSFEWILNGSVFATTQNITISPLETSLYILNATNFYGCVGSDSIWIFTLDTPIAEIIQDDTLNSCLGDSIVFNVEGTGIESYLWNTGETSQSIKVCPAIADSTYKYYVDIFNENGCSISDTSWLIVNPLPIFELGNDTTLCLHDSLTIYGPDTTGLNYSFEWIENGSVFATTQNITISPLDTSLYILNATNIYGCVGSDSIWIFTLEMPIAEIIQDDTLNICLGDSVVFTVEGTGIDSYLWNTGDTSQSIKVCPAIADTTYKYYVDIFNENGCSISDTSWLIVNSFPEVLILADDLIEVCEGETVNLSVDVSGNYIYTVIWDFNTNSDTNVFNVSYTADISGMVYCEAKTIYGCNTTDSIYIMANPLADVITSEDVDICLGDTITISATGADYFYWILDQDTISTDEEVEVYPLDTTKYYVFGEMATGCKGSDSVLVNVLSMPETVIVYDGDNPLCQNSTITLTGEGADNYLWSTGETTDEISFILTEEVLIELTGINNTGCSSNDSLRIFVVPSDTVSFSGLLPAYCENDSPSILLGIPEGGVFSGSGVVGNEFRPSLAGSGYHTVKYIYINDDYCEGIDSASTVIYGSGQEIDIGDDQIINPTEFIELDAGPGFSNYYWSTGSIYRNIMIYYTDNPPGSVVRYVVMGVINGCSSQGETNITFADPDGIGENSKSKLKIFPNPNSGIFRISYLEEVQSFNLFIYDYYGQLIYTQYIECNQDCEINIELPELSNGLYLIKTVSNKGVSSSKLLIN